MGGVKEPEWRLQYVRFSPEEKPVPILTLEDVAAWLGARHRMARLLRGQEPVEA